MHDKERGVFMITIARQCGCGGEEIGRLLSETCSLPFYDKKALIALAKEKGIYESMPNFFSEKPINSLLYAIAAGESVTKLGTGAVAQVRDMLARQSAVMIGRCGNYIFRGEPKLLRIFLGADIEQRIATIQEKHKLAKHRAKVLVQETDEQRAAFHKYYTGESWGQAQYYDICLNITGMTKEQVVKIILEYVQQMPSFLTLEINRK